MTITVNTDASYSHQHKVGAFAYWITTENGRYKNAGVLRNVQDSLDAELQAIANAFHSILKKEWTGITHIYINTDCEAAINLLKKKKIRTLKAKKTYHAADFIVSTLEKLGDANKHSPDFYSIRHVKGHSGKDSPRKFVNDWCDKASRKLMKDHIKALLVK
jgi:ribonuclease HI